MSSTTGLARARSIRNLPTNTTITPKDNEKAQNKPVQSRGEPRNVSPSRLPMKPPPRPTTSSTAAATSSTRTRAPNGITARQVSGSTSTKSTKPTSRSTENGVPADTKPLKPLGRTSSVRQAPTRTATRTSSVSIARSATTARPRSSEEVSSPTPSKARHLGHSRAKSTAVTSLTAATTLRPLSHAPARSNPSPAPSNSSSTSNTTQATTASSTRAKTRSQTYHARVPSQPQSHSSTAASTLAARRPAFNTNQQHYSPAKSSAPKPLTSTFLAPPSPSKQPVNVALTAETSRLQTELLQLSLLHREAHNVSASWHASARSKLGARFKELAAAEQALREIERADAEARGLEDLIRWGNADPQVFDGNGGDDQQEKLPLDEKIQLLDRVLNGAWALGEPGGRYRRAVCAFEDWVRRVGEIRAAQRSGDVDGLLTRGGSSGFDLGSGSGSGQESEVRFFVSDLDASAWKRDHAGLVRVLEGWRRTLAQLGDVDADPDNDSDGQNTRAGKARNKPSQPGDPKGSKSQSGLARTLRGCRSLVHGMLAELRLMEQIEQDALAVEAAWMEQMEAQLRAEETEDSRRRTEDVPPWKLLLL